MMKIYIRDPDNQPVGLIIYEFDTTSVRSTGKSLVIKMAYSRCSKEDTFDKEEAYLYAVNRFNKRPTCFELRHALTQDEVRELFDDMKLPFDPNFEAWVPSVARIINTELVCYLLSKLGLSSSRDIDGREAPDSKPTKAKCNDKCGCAPAQAPNTKHRVTLEEFLGLKQPEKRNKPETKDTKSRRPVSFIVVEDDTPRKYTPEEIAHFIDRADSWFMGR